MNQHDTALARQLAEAARALQQQRTGHAPKAVTVVLSEDTLVVTLHDALTPAEKALARTPDGAAQVQEFHRQLFATSAEEMRQEIQRITGREVREAATEIETTTGSVILAFGTGAMVQVYLLSPLAHQRHDGEPIERADDDGLRVTPNPDDESAATP